MKKTILSIISAVVLLAAVTNETCAAGNQRYYCLRYDRYRSTVSSSLYYQPVYRPYLTTTVIYSGPIYSLPNYYNVPPIYVYSQPAPIYNCMPVYGMPYYVYGRY